MDSRREVLRQTGLILAGEAVVTCAMFGVFALLGRFSAKVLWGGVLGAALATLNFFLMALTVNAAADRAVETEDVKGGTMLVRGSSLVRLAAIFAILFAAVKAGVADPIAAVVPLVFVHWILMLKDFFGKKKAREDGAEAKEAEREDAT